MFLDTADMPTQTISLSHDAKEEDGGNQSVTQSTLSWLYSSYHKMHVSKSRKTKNNFFFYLIVEDTVNNYRQGIFRKRHKGMSLSNL